MNCAELGRQAFRKGLYLLYVAVIATCVQICLLIIFASPMRQ